MINKFFHQFEYNQYPPLHYQYFFEQYYSHPGQSFIAFKLSGGYHAT